MSFTLAIDDTCEPDAAAVELLLDVSFGIDRRIKSSYRLREGNHPVPGLSMVIRDAELGLAGTISFWPLRIGPDGAAALLLGPLAVHPERQNLGIGLALMRQGLARATAMGHRLVLLVGDEPYYGRAGFRKLPPGLIGMPGPVNADRFLYLELVPGALAGIAGMALPPYRFAGRSAAFAIPHGAETQEQQAQA